ncbi:hypothetical protein Y032_0948g3170 [Ancylostoma ceylanicum]|uniref:Saposin B-type domain-containing protein n=1 Tax=Ancylostoma ceylanicum TaxID=53326 RepID=A0A016W8T6_9BILA|nr:hypothetical protein Y032_0948g3170 [Ancylostoma ceylanicum]
MRAFLLPFAVAIAVVFCEVGNLDHLSDCFICNHILTTATMARSGLESQEYKRPTCNRIAAEFLANKCLVEKYMDRQFPDDTRTGPFLCEFFFPQKYCRDGKYE